MRSRSMNIATDGTLNHAVIWASRMNFAGAITLRCGITQRHAPASQVTKRSWTERSKVKSNACELRSSGPSP